MSVSHLDGGQCWYVAFTQASAELRAAKHLDNQGFPTYIPRFLKKRRSARKIEQVIAPLFPRYIFVGIDLASQRWRSINGTVGISHLVCQGDKPTAVSADILSAIARQEGEDGLVRLPEARRFKPGETVRVLDGVFADHLGLYEGLGDRERVLILLDLLGRKVKVQVELDAIAAA
jgi:transcriptional antiterminator RfaH